MPSTSESPSNMSPQSPSPTVKTRILIISDTHAATLKPKLAGSPTTDDELNTTKGRIQAPTGFRDPLPEADVVLHCGDLTKRGEPAEFRTTFSMLRALKAPLKLVIAGNHDLALDEPHYCDGMGMEKSGHAEVLQTIREAEQDGVRYLTEGTYTFDLGNGARLRIYASQYTPRFGYWAFQYYDNEHDFDIPPGIDIAMTHGPPLGVFDLARNSKRAGCNKLFQAIHASKPLIHCFGHIHEAWGAGLMQWNPSPNADKVLTRETAIDTAHSRSILRLKNIMPSISHHGVSPEEEGKEDEKRKRLVEMSKKRGCHVDLTEGENAIKRGQQTLFVNAAIMNVGYRPTQMPWLVDVSLPKAGGFVSDLDL